MELFILITIAITLSMDAFSLSLAYGTLGFSKKEIIMLSIIVGIYHFFMPIIGNTLGTMVLKIIKVDINIIVFLVFTIIGIQMILESLKKEENISLLKIPQMFLFGLAVSIDSFSVGVGLRAITNNYILASIIFSLTSLVFTYIGLKTGKYINDKIGKMSSLLGGGIIIIFGILYLFNLI
ncbi:MAG: manganese efflux pump MntP family protein [Clostridium sp.]|nr:manganese efflux pump MntP family protein [Clostridium sp.]MCM1443741.1 manganese efflux pump MntP family protein [Candidatus Amulumruptor caecigallinarius]